MKRFQLVLGFILIWGIWSSWNNPAYSASLGITAASLPGPQTMRRTMQSILTDRRFSYPDYFSWWNKLWTRFFRWMERLKWWQPAKKLPLDAFLTKALNYLGLLLLVFLPFALAFFLPRLFQKEKRLQQTTHSRVGEKSDSRQFLQQAVTLADQGLTLEAIRHVYLAALEHLKKQAVLRNSVNFSDKENLLLLRRAWGIDHQASAAFAALITLFQEKWYGLKICQRSDYDQAVILAEIILESVGKSHA